MGLLDTMDDPQFRLGMGLLAAGSARSDGAGFGQRINEVLGGMDSWNQQKQKQKFLDMQMKNYESEIAQRQAAIDKQTKVQELISGMFGGSPTAALEQGAAVGDFGPTKTNAARMNGSGVSGLTPEKLALLKLNGVDLTDVYKLTRPNLTNVNGTMVDTTDPKNTGQFIADPTKGFTFSGGKVGVLPGFLDAQTAIVGGQAQATEGAKAGLDIVNVTTTENGKEVIRQMPRDVAASLLRGQNQPAGTDGIPGSGLDMSRVSPEQLKLMANTDPEAMRLGAQRFQRAGQQTQQGQTQFGVGLSNEEKDAQKLEQARQTELLTQSAKIGAQKIYDSHDLAKGASDALLGLHESRKAIAGGVYGGAGADIKQNLAKGIQALGFNVDPQKVTDTDYLQSQLGQGILSKAKTLGANPTDNDARIIRDIVGSINTDPQALNKLLDYQEKMYRRSIDRHNEMYQGALKNKFQSPYDMTVEQPKFDGASPEAKTFQMLPPANQYAGKRMKSEDGSVYKSNGKKWIKE